MAEMYLNFTNNHNYTSFINKLKYNVLYYRYIYHCKKNINLFSHNIFLNLFGFLIYLFDRINLIIKKNEKENKSLILYQVLKLVVQKLF